MTQAPVLPGIRLIVGLGNPGERYADTRHNAGAWFVTALAKQQQVTLRPETKFHASVASFSAQGEKCLLAIPSTFMNVSGLAVAKLAHFYQLAPEQILIAHDELDFITGLARLKASGGHGGHNGLRSVAERLRSSDFYRLRIGIGHPGDKVQVASYVLKTPAVMEQRLIDQAIDESLVIVDDVILGNFERAMNWLHG